jgi:hypothetical protein
MRHSNVTTTMGYVHVEGLEAAAEKLADYVESGPRVASSVVAVVGKEPRNA